MVCIRMEYFQHHYLEKRKIASRNVKLLIWGNGISAWTDKTRLGYITDIRTGVILGKELLLFISCLSVA